nr:hypothetical protein [Tanacetum cinerariifolium]
MREKRRSNPLPRALTICMLKVQAELLSLAASAGFERGLARLENIPASRDTRVSPPLVKESTMTPVSESLKLPSNLVPASSTVALEPTWSGVGACFLRPSDVVVAFSVGEKGDGFMPSSTVNEEAAATPSGV